MQHPTSSQRKNFKHYNSLIVMKISGDEKVLITIYSVLILALVFYALFPEIREVYGPVHDIIQEYVLTNIFLFYYAYPAWLLLQSIVLSIVSFVIKLFHKDKDRIDNFVENITKLGFSQGFAKFMVFLILIFFTSLLLNGVDSLINIELDEIASKTIGLSVILFIAFLTQLFLLKSRGKKYTKVDFKLLDSSIELWTDKENYSPGDSIAGKIDFCLKKPIYCKLVNVRIRARNKNHTYTTAARKRIGGKKVYRNGDSLIFSLKIPKKQEPTSIFIVGEAKIIIDSIFTFNMQDSKLSKIVSKK
jgi:hypothetical protein